MTVLGDYLARGFQASMAGSAPGPSIELGRVIESKDNTFGNFITQSHRWRRKTRREKTQIIQTKRAESLEHAAAKLPPHFNYA